MRDVEDIAARVAAIGLDRANERVQRFLPAIGERDLDTKLASSRASAEPSPPAAPVMNAVL